MNIKGLGGVLTGAIISWWGVLDYFLRSPESQDNSPAKLGVVVFTLMGITIMIVVSMYHRSSDRIFLSGASVMATTIAVTLILFFSEMGRYKIGLWPILAAVFSLGFFWLVDGIAKSKPSEAIPTR